MLSFTHILVLPCVLALSNVFVLAAETIHRREYFYVGGTYESNGHGEHIFKNQMYVEHLRPINGVRKENPIVFVHGQGQTGTNWLNKPDGKRGWASYFLEQGYECYIIDQTFRGRSAWFPGNGTMDMLSAERLETYFTATRRHELWPQAKLHTQWPGSGLMGDRIFDAYYASTVQFLADELYQQAAIRNAAAALLDRIGRPVVVIAHSQGGTLGWFFADTRPDLVASLISMEPGGPPFESKLVGSGPARKYGLTDVPITYFPRVVDPDIDLVKQTIRDNQTGVSCIIQAESPAPRKLANLANVPILLVTSESGYHAVYDWCTAKYLEQAGVHVRHLQLGEAGIHGNGHMMFLESNSDVVAKALQEWMEGHGRLLKQCAGAKSEVVPWADGQC
ncbi:hypothetical protein LOZ12_000515 [Ophidiomyces ophidiicola]|uniref:Uncharacterized protein n=1 Tax=Ophidiomyces ophidiicola TaxID=1387563 RepID=A0ACB8V520_9EURO|nr:uncharacterized protein LOZ57_003411 [Ophidiomyces ophidiicola]KAI1915444.1 hypothetical protein LOZ61_001638 [Ophidiomyces ophidiicola]KAI1926058.1 hypothetical protein LOZ64_000375 [Ophidiomyces ophidiicola]KAI1929883.1 hypothetical protein LOZ60_001351 [Ophidiomyces ophidiicola]KAI1947173.1 hypothetical protein LOZ57_003411 [Ophidiomyces ophidiicola]KAI1955689.1 hypothetical protein LOZ62_000240 [Ophidiomyces ophidiicola]